MHPRPVKYISPSKPITSSLTELSFPCCVFSMSHPTSPGSIPTDNSSPVFRNEIRPQETCSNKTEQSHYERRLLPAATRMCTAASPAWQQTPGPPSRHTGVRHVSEGWGLYWGRVIKCGVMAECELHDFNSRVTTHLLTLVNTGRKHCNILYEEENLHEKCFCYS